MKLLIGLNDAPLCLGIHNGEQIIRITTLCSNGEGAALVAGPAQRSHSRTEMLKPVSQNQNNSSDGSDLSGFIKDLALPSSTDTSNPAQCV